MLSGEKPKNEKSPQVQQALMIIEHMLKVGFPNLDNMAKFKSLTEDLKKLSHHLSSTDQMSVNQIDKVFQKMQAMLEVEGNISTEMYAILNRLHIILETSLRIAR